jgi:hypothetical protein
VLVWRLDRWGRLVTDLLATLQELNHLGVGFVPLTEALTPYRIIGQRPHRAHYDKGPTSIKAYMGGR